MYKNDSFSNVNYYHCSSKDCLLNSIVNPINNVLEYKYDNTSWNPNYNNSGGGEFTQDGKIITFWYEKK